MGFMEPAPKRLSRPVYESLPWLYLACGVAACVGSYFLPAGVLSLIVGFAGIAIVLGGVVILLRRRDYRELRSQYGEPGALDVVSPTPKNKTDA
jgi:Flp pilus assembly protein TadB